MDDSRPSSDRVFVPVQTSVFQVGTDLFLAWAGDGVHAQLSGTEARTLLACTGGRTLGEHAAAVVRTRGADRVAVADALDRLVTLSLLRPADQIVGLLSSRPTLDREGIDAIIVVTRNRPGLVLRALHSIVAHCESVDRRPAIIVVDGSPEGELATREAVVTTAGSVFVPIHYIGHAEAAAFRSALATSGVPERALRAALTPGEIGANRNLGILLTAGLRVVMIDDDVLCTPWLLPDHECDALAIGGHSDTGVWRFLRTRSEAIGTVEVARHDLLGAHSELLGRDLAALIARPGRRTDLSPVCAHTIGALARQEPSRVRVTLTGLAGDSGRYCPHRLLGRAGSLRETLAANDDILEVAITSREIQHAVRMVTVTHEPACMSYCMGIDGTELVPPFTPRGRGEDTLFGAMLAHMDQGVLFGMVPYGVIHDSLRPSSYGAANMPSARQTRLADFLIGATQRCAPARIAPTPGIGLQRLAEMYADLSRLSPSGLVPFIRDVVMTGYSRQCAAMDEAPPGLTRSPRWRAAVDAYRTALRESSAQPGFFVPMEFAEAASVVDGFFSLQRFLSEFGEVLTAWPTIWTHAAKLERRGGLPVLRTEAP